MRTITCKKCGAVIDASIGECPVCGTVYYILPEETKPEKEASDFLAETKDYFSPKDFDVASASRDDIFNTSAWKVENDADSTRAFTPQPQQTRAYTPQPQPTRRPPQEAVRRAAPPPEPPQKKGMSVGSKRVIVAALALLAVLTLVISVMSGAFDFSKNKEKLTMPTVLNFAIESAEGLLRGMGLEVETAYEADTSPAGTVIKQSKREGAVIKPGDKVLLTVSKGPDQNTSPEVYEEVEVPYVIGKSFDQASYELANLNLLIQTGEPAFSDEPEGRIISQNPAKGSLVRKGDMVLVILSKGPEPSPSPAGFAITVTAGSGGTVTPKGVVTVVEGESATFSFMPNEGYEVREVKVDGADVGAVSSYTFDNVTGDHTLYVVFKLKSETTTTPPTTTPPTTETLPPSPEAPVD